MSFHKCSTCPHRHDSVFCNLDFEKIMEIDKQKSMVWVKKGDLIYRQGTFPKGLYCIKKGKIKLSQTCINGKDQVLKIAGVSDIIGYSAILGNDTYSCSATATEDCILCFLPKTFFFTLVENNPKLAMEVFNFFSAEMRQLEYQITKSSQRTAKERLAQCILYLITNYGFEKDSTIINSKISREEIASIVGTTRETTTRALHVLQANKIIELVGKKIKVLDNAQLSKIANLPD